MYQYFKTDFSLLTCLYQPEDDEIKTELIFLNEIFFNFFFDIGPSLFEWYSVYVISLLALLCFIYFFELVD